MEEHKHDYIRVDVDNTYCYFYCKICGITSENESEVSEICKDLSRAYSKGGAERIEKMINKFCKNGKNQDKIKEMLKRDKFQDVVYLVGFPYK